MSQLILLLLWCVGISCIFGLHSENLLLSVLVYQLIPLYSHFCRRTSLSVLMMGTTKSSMNCGQTVSHLRSWIQTLRLWAWSLTSTFISPSIHGGVILPHTYGHRSLHYFNACIWFCIPAFLDYFLQSHVDFRTLRYVLFTGIATKRC